MGSNGYKDKVIMSVGGSLIVPETGINTDFLAKLNNFVREELANNENRQFFLVIGGGVTAREYRDAGREVIHHELARDDLDWLGIHASRLNAHLVRTIFRDIAHPYIVKHYEIIRKVTEPVVVAAAWQPGWSTDYDAVLLCEDYGAREIINLSNIDRVHDQDPRKFPDSKPYDRMTWEEFRKIVGDEWVPGMNAPFDPVAAKKAQEVGVKVAILNGNNFENVKNYIEGREFVGTVVEG